MKFSDKILTFTNAPLFQTQNLERDESYLFKLEKHSAYIELAFDITKRDGDEYFVNLSYKTALATPYLGILDGLVQLFQGKAIQAVERITAKELDYFLRDSQSIPALSYYDPKFYEILSIGEMINKKRYGEKTARTFLFEEYDGLFFELSFSEQIEFFEEFLSRFIYKNEKFLGIQFDLEDVNDNEIRILTSQNISQGGIDVFLKIFKEEFDLSSDVEVKFLR